MIKRFKTIGAIYLLVTILIIVSFGAYKGAVAYDSNLPDPDPVFHVEFDGLWDLNFNEARDLVLHFDKLFDTMGDSPYPPPTYALLNDLTAEASPFFEYEGMDALAKWSSPIGLHAFQEAGKHIHVAGQSNCAGYILNYRFANPFSSWFGEGSWVATAIHEMVHVQQGYLCGAIKSFYLENTAEIMSLEVMAGMVNYGNRDMTYALIRKLRGMAASAAYGLALEEDRLEDYESLREQILDDPYKDAAYDKSRRFWESDPERLDFILRAYSIVPLERIVQAIMYNDTVIEGLILPSGMMIAGVFVHGPPIALDDLAYFLEHIDEIVGRYVEEREK